MLREGKPQIWGLHPRQPPHGSAGYQSVHEKALHLESILTGFHASFKIWRPLEVGAELGALTDHISHKTPFFMLRTGRQLPGDS